MSQNSVTLVVLVCLVDFIEQAVAGADYCANGHICPSPQKCCQTTCCLPDGYEHHYKTFRWTVWNMWYFWFVMIFVLMSCFGGCGYWRRRQLLLAQQHHAMLHSAGYNDLFNRRLRSLRSAAAAHAHHRHHSQHVPVPMYAGFDSTFPPVSSSFTRNMVPSNRGPPEGMFPQPPPYSEVAKEGEFSPYPPQYKDDNLPPYPGDSYRNIDQHLGPANERELSGVGEQVPGLPPYSPSTNQNTTSEFTANLHSAISGPGTTAQTSPCPTNDYVSPSTNECSSYGITSSSQEPSNTRHTSEVNTNPLHNLDTNDFQRSPESVELPNENCRTIPT